MKKIDVRAAFKKGKRKAAFILMMLLVFSVSGQEIKNEKPSEKVVDSLESLELHEEKPVINKAEDYKILHNTQNAIIVSLQKELNNVIEDSKAHKPGKKIITKTEYVTIYKVVPFYLPSNYILKKDSSFGRDTLTGIYYKKPKLSIIKRIFSKHKN